MELNRLGQAKVLRDAAADVAVSRELARRRRLLTLEVRTLNLFLAHRTFKERMGGTPRRAILLDPVPARASRELSTSFSSSSSHSTRQRGPVG